jgi:hypothetical protein
VAHRPARGRPESRVTSVRPTWIKVYGDLLSDSTIQRWSPGLRYCWIGALLIAAQSPEPGVLVDDSRTPLAVGDLGELLHVSWDTARRFQERALESRKLVRLEDTGALAVKNYLARQDGDPAIAEIARESLGDRSIFGTDVLFTGAPAYARFPERSDDTAQGSDDSGSTAGREKEVSTAVLPVRSGLPFQFSEGRAALIRDVAAGLSDADPRTERAIASVARGLPEGALHRAVEALERRRRDRGRPLRSEARYLVAALKRMREEGQYA